MRGYDRFAELYARLHMPVWRYLVKLGASRDVAEDLTQEAFIKWWNSAAAALEPPRARAYLFTIASRLLIDWHRRHRREAPWTDALDQQASADAEPIGLIGGRAWAQLSIREQQLLWLAYAEEFSHVEIGAICGIAGASVKVLLHRARTRIATLLEEGDRHDG